MKVEFKDLNSDVAEALPGPAASRGRGEGSRLAAALAALAQGHGTLVEHRQQPWASITFTGARHELVFAFGGTAAVAAGEHLIAQAAEHEFAIPGQLVADVAVVAVEHTLLPEPRLTVRLEVLMLEDR